MKLINFEKLGVELKSLVLRYSVELVVCVATFVFCRIGGEFDDAIWLMPIVFGVVFAANNIITSSKYRYIYYATALLIIPAVVVDAREFLASSAYWFSILLSAIVMLLSKKDRSDSRIGENFANMAMSVVVAMTVFLLLWALIGAIVASTIYIFGIDVSVWSVIEPMVQLVGYVVAPMTFLYCQDAEVSAKVIRMRFFDILFNYIISTALIVYTAILYVYMIKIVLQWTLPVGGLAAMITTFYIVAFAGLLLNKVLPNRYCHWFYRYFGYISLPLLVLFWSGLSHRIMQYSFTESRVYMALAGVTMVMGTVVLIVARKNRFAIILSIAAVLIAVFTYIPGITALSIGIDCQRERMLALAREIGIYDEDTQKILGINQLPDEDNEKYREMYESYRYLANEYSWNTMEKMYGVVNVDIIENENSSGNYQWLNRACEVHLGDYNCMQNRYDYTVDVENQEVVVNETSKGKVLHQPVKAVEANENGEVTDEQMITYSNEQYLLVLDCFRTKNGKLDDVTSCMIYKKE